MGDEYCGDRRSSWVFTDKVMWLDSAWDTVHTLVRPVGGALLALAIVDPSDPATQVVAFLLGGGASFLAHSGKASARAVVNTSPEPVSNVAVSTIEDVATLGLLWMAKRVIRRLFSRNYKGIPEG